MAEHATSTTTEISHTIADTTEKVEADSPVVANGDAPSSTKLKAAVNDVIAADNEADVKGGAKKVVSADSEADVKGGAKKVVSADSEAKVKDAAKKVISADSEAKVKDAAKKIISANSEAKVKDAAKKVVSADSEAEVKDSAMEVISADSEVEVKDAAKNIISGEELTKLKRKVSNQIEYYFSDINLSRDKFLLDIIAKDDGWVELATMLKFNRLNQMTTDCEVIVSALKSSTKDLMEVSEDGKKVRRLPSKKLPDNTRERQDELMLRTVYVKGFPVDSKLDELCSYFTENHGPQEQVFMRTWGGKEARNFKGSVFVIFEKKEDADKLVNAEKVEYKEKDLIRLFKKAYFDQKNAERHNRGNKNKTPDKKDKPESEETSSSCEKFMSEITRGAVLRLRGVTAAVDLSHIKNFFMDVSPVAWVDIHRTNKEALVRFKGAGAAQTAVDEVKEANGGKLVIENIEMETKVLEGEEELAHWRRVFKELETWRSSQRQKSHSGGKRKFGKKGVKTRGNKHKKFKNDDSDDDNDDDCDDKADAPPKKSAKMDNVEEMDDAA